MSLWIQTAAKSASKTSEARQCLERHAGQREHEAEASIPELFAKDSILFSQVVDCALVMLAQPASKAGDEE